MQCIVTTPPYWGLHDYGVARRQPGSALGAFYRRLAARVGRATARKITILFYRAMRFGMRYQDPGADQYELRYKERVIKQLHRRAAHFGCKLQPAEVGVS
ncbi:hypothetical protein [Cupriavidus basilensis]|uniref:hypothetical protein n=1 Tax=Cupriavidus basilensis TaxID=68895 RepID=UPI0039F73BD4